MKQLKTVGFIFQKPTDVIATIGVGMAAAAGTISCAEMGRQTYHMLTDSVEVRRRKPGHLFQKETVKVRLFDGKIMGAR